MKELNLPQGPLPNRLFALYNDDFALCCERAGIKPTKRQASKFRMRKGKAYQAFCFEPFYNQEVR